MIIKRFKENSHIPISEIRRQQAKHKIDLIQPRNGDGEINPDFVQHYGVKNLNVTKHDVQSMSHKSLKFSKILDEQRRKTGR
jgi:hypothetical protein